MPTPSTSLVHTLMVTAHPAEARPLIDHWHLRRDANSRAFPIYHSRRSGEPISLVVSGTGKINAAAACAHIYNLCAPQRAIWLNTGIAGHALLAPGDAFIAHSAEDANSGQRWYPPIGFEPQCGSQHLVSVDRADANYPDNAAVDMEASAFFAVASRYSTAELVHAIKVISDNRRHPREQISTDQVSQWMANVVALLQHTLVALRELASCVAPAEQSLPPFVQSFRLTVCQRKQCLDLLRRWRALQPAAPPPTAPFAKSGSAREALIALRALVEAQTVNYAP